MGTGVSPTLKPPRYYNRCSSKDNFVELMKHTQLVAEVLVVMKVKKYQASRIISITRLNALLRLHL